MKIKLNGEDYETDAESIKELLSGLKIASGRVAVEVNLVIVKKAEYESYRLKDGDRVEVVNFVGGGCLKQNAKSIKVSQGQSFKGSDALTL